MARDSIRATRPSSLAFSSGCTIRANSRAPGSDSRWCIASCRGTAGGYGRKASPARARRSISHCCGARTMEGFEQIEILLVEDNPLDAELTMTALKGGKVANNITWVKDGEE